VLVVQTRTAGLLPGPVAITSAGTCNALSSSANLAAPMSSQSYAKPEFAGPQIYLDEMHSDAMIKDFKASLFNTQDAMHYMKIRNSMWECMKHRSCNKTYISNEQPHTIEL
jgi:hypothetical protein